MIAALSDMWAGSTAATSSPHSPGEAKLKSYSHALVGDLTDPQLLNLLCTSPATLNVGGFLLKCLKHAAASTCQCLHEQIDLPAKKLLTWSWTWWKNGGGNKKKKLTLRAKIKIYKKNDLI